MIQHSNSGNNVSRYIKYIICMLSLRACSVCDYYVIGSQRPANLVYYFCIAHHHSCNCSDVLCIGTRICLRSMQIILHFISKLQHSYTEPCFFANETG